MLKKKCLLIDYESSNMVKFSQDHQFVYDILFADSFDRVVKLYTQYYVDIDCIVLCLDGAPHLDVMNKLLSISALGVKRIVLSTRSVDYQYIFNMMLVYAAIDFVPKPFNAMRLNQSFKNLSKKETISIDKKHSDLTQFNRFIDAVYAKLNILDKVSYLGFSTVDRQVAMLKNLQKVASQLMSFEDPVLPKILVVEDEFDVYSIYGRVLTNKLFHCEFARSLAESFQMIRQYKFDIVVLDLGLPDGHGGELIAKIHEQQIDEVNQCDFLVISGFFDKQLTFEVINQGVKILLNKPISSNKFLSSLYQLIYFRYAKQTFNEDIVNSIKDGLMNEQ